MTVEEAKAYIFDRLCSQYHKNNRNDLVDGDIVRKDKNIPEAIFNAALKDFKDAHGQLYVQVDSQRRLKLGSSGEQHCQDKTNPFK